MLVGKDWNEEAKPELKTNGLAVFESSTFAITER